MKLFVVQLESPEHDERTGYADARRTRFAYRGVDRISAPAFQSSSFGEDHEFNQVMRDLSERTVQNPNTFQIIPDPGLARRVVEVYKKHLDADYEILELVIDNEQQILGSEFLGYDVLNSGFGDSLLKNGLEIGYDGKVVIAQDRRLQTFLRRNYPLQVLLKRYFRPRLNSNALFSSYKVAKFYLACETAIASSTLDTKVDWEARGYQVVGTYKVP